MKISKQKQIEEVLTCIYELQQFQNDIECRNAKLDYCIKKIDDKFPLSSISLPSPRYIQPVADLKKLWTGD